LVSGWGIAVLVIAVPLGLSALLWLTGWVEARLVAPDERAERVRDALEAHCEPGEIEELAVSLTEQALPADGPRRRGSARFLVPGLLPR
jgi:hypothetical protein